ncbi:oxidoreductase [Longimycelium tulufanense]|uniref:Oxidoreductase n=1 Tax=Longimycelium tulufanense TaxID=907463 RepID=A0A8J3FT34_9PSEU|nr:FAD-binding oxidoreductase [Longimycelium tulufanense]GGM45546.1 oxidoreductase [Longimycelium tulufanense]
MRVIVVGAGIVGASAAYRLARQGVDVLVVDRADVGQATAAGAGVIFPWPVGPVPPAHAALHWAAADHYPRLLTDLAEDGITDAGYTRVGGMTVAEDTTLLRGMRDELVALRGRGATGLGEIDLLAPAEARDRFPVLGPDLAAVAVAGIGRLDGRTLRDALLTAAARHGARRRVGAARLARAGDRVTGVEMAGEVLGAHAVVLAAGAWTAELCRPLGRDLPVYPQRGQLAHLLLPGAETERWPVVRTLGEHYLLAFPGSRLVVGATREKVGFDHRATAGGVHAVLDNALATAPGLAEATLAEMRVGFRPASRDGLPLLGPLSGLGGLVVATGLGAGGLTLGPITGEVAADLALGREPGCDLTPLRPDRNTHQVVPTA